MLPPARFGCSLALFVAILPLRAAPLSSCAQGARAFFPCELTFDWRANELPAGASPYQDGLFSIEFRSPAHKTYLMRAFWNGGQTLHVRFTPTEAGQWTYRIASSIPRYDNQESTFAVTETGYPGFVSVANLRHWWTTNKQPHLWLAASAPLATIDPSTLGTWLDARKQDGFTHIRGTLLSLAGPLKPLTSDGQPNHAYFDALDDRILAAVNRGFTVDLILADDAFVRSGAFSEWQNRDLLIRYIVARYGGLNVTWQGIEHFENVPGSRALLKDLGSFLQKYDTFQHPRSTDASVSSWPLINDGWMDYLIEASPQPEVAAVEHQFTQKPEIHVITATEPNAFRHELWNCTTNGEYPSVSYEALRNEANLKAVRTWFKIVSDTRHWEFEPYFDVSGARAVGLEEIGYIVYAQNPGIVEINLEKHKYNPVWINPANGEEAPLKDYRTDIFSRSTPDNSHDWILDVEREGHKENMLHSVYFASIDAPVQEIETDASKIPFEITDPPGDVLIPGVPSPFQAKLTKHNRSTRYMQYVWWGEVVAGGAGARLLAVGSFGNLTVPKEFAGISGADLNIRLMALNANGKAYELDKVYRLGP